MGTATANITEKIRTEMNISRMKFSFLYIFNVFIEFDTFPWVLPYASCTEYYFMLYFNYTEEQALFGKVNRVFSKCYPGFNKSIELSPNTILDSTDPLLLLNR